MTLSIMTIYNNNKLNTTLSIMRVSSFMLSVANKLFMLSVIVLSVVMLNVTMLSVVMLNVIML